MSTDTNLMDPHDYAAFIERTTREIEARFTEQQEFLACKKGCSHCCESGIYPVSETEFDYLKDALDSLDGEFRDIVKRRVTAIDKKYRNKPPARYKCPLLTGGGCSVYHRRPLMCRTYGLIYRNPGTGGVNLPSCLKKGLNYANIWDPSTQSFSRKMAADQGITSEPRVYNESHDTISRTVKLGETRMIYQWLRDYLD